MALKIYKESIHSHLGDHSDAHDASSVSFVPEAGLASTNVQDAIVEVVETVTAGAIPNSSITVEKLAFDPVTQQELMVYGHEVWSQILPLTSWTIIHSIPYMPSVTIVDSFGSVVLGDVRYVDPTTIEVSFSAPFSGDAYLS